MAPQGPSSYGDVFAPVYDSWYEAVSDVDATVGAVAELAGGGRVLELGVGTGRLAVPLAARGVDVVGVDASAEMLHRCVAKPGSRGIDLVRGDMAALPLRGPFEVVLVAFNTFFNLITPAAQHACVHEAARVLGPTGSFMVEAAVPSAEPAHRTYDESSRPDGAGGRIVCTAVRDPADQTVSGVHIHRPAAGPVRRLPWTIRYVHLHQLDELCARAGLRLADRHLDWGGAPLPHDPDRHVSRYVPVPKG